MSHDEGTPPDQAKRDLERRLKEMQPDQVVLEGSAPKKRLSLASAWIITGIATVVPLRVRTTFGLVANFLFNQAKASVFLLMAWISQAFASVMIFLVYWLVLGPTALLVQLLRHDYLAYRDPGPGSLWSEKDPPDTTEDRFMRQF